MENPDYSHALIMVYIVFVIAVVTFIALVLKLLTLIQDKKRIIDEQRKVNTEGKRLLLQAKLQLYRQKKIFDDKHWSPPDVLELSLIIGKAENVSPMLFANYMAGELHILGYRKRIKHNED